MDLQNKSKEELIARIQKLEAELKKVRRPPGSYNMTLDLQSSKLIKNRFDESQKNNPHFSLRAFAKKVGVSPGRISEIFKGQYILSREMAQRIVESLDFDEVQKKAFLDAVELENNNLEEFREFMKSLADKENFYSKKLNNLEEHSEVKLMDHWTFYGMMAALSLKECDHSAQWLAKKMKLDVATAIERLETMVRLGIVKKAEGLYYLVPQNNFNNGISTSLRASQIAAFKCSISAYNYMAQRFSENIQSEKPDSDLQNNVYFFIQAVDSSKIGNAPEFLAQNAYKSIEEMSKTPDLDAVYMVNIAFLKI